LAEGQGSTLNIPVKAGSNDEDFLRHFEQDLAPALEVFKPQFILLSAGFDAHRNDPLGQILLSEDGYRSLTQRVRQMAELHCNGRLISMLEGGYDLQSTAQSIEAHLQALMAD
jgi:acetoin utilization deacetylase AcuC-like enzyme